MNGIQKVQGTDVRFGMLRAPWSERSINQCQPYIQISEKELL